MITRIDEPTTKPNYEEMCAKTQHEADYWHNEYRQLMSEVIYLRGVKHTLEAIIGRKIDDANP